MDLPWNAGFALGAPLFAPLAQHARHFRADDWPECAALNALADAAGAPCNANGHSIRFVPQAPTQPAFEDKYEPRIYLRGEVQMRAANWHDLFNALVWLVFPRAKAALNRRHYAAQCAQRDAGAANRGPQQDALTLFDEGGIVVLCADSSLGELLRGHEWHRLFWQRRADLSSAMAFVVFGHALYEKGLQPFAGVTGRGLILDCDAALIAAAPAAQSAWIDAQLAALLDSTGSLTATRDLTPVPILGIPGWCADNAREDYYANTAYFRPRRASPADRR
jgi:hypothetical protein